jgi:hypothetical protein
VATLYPIKKNIKELTCPYSYFLADMRFLRNSIFKVFLMLILGCTNSESEDSKTFYSDVMEEKNHPEIKKIMLFDTTIQTFIEAVYPDEFVKLTNTEKLTDCVLLHQDSIRSYFERENLNYDTYFVKIDRITVDSSSLKIPVWDLEAFYFDREHFGKYVGSPSEGSGTIEIELTSGKVLQKWKWQ